MNLLDHIKNTLRKYAMLSHGDIVLIGLSGGADSVCLLVVLDRIKAEYGITLSAAYIDHGLRPDETPREIAFCSALCSALGVPFFTQAIDVPSYAREKGLSTQEAARELRYRALETIARKRGATKIAVGHNADDQAETILMRLFRGSGPAGLSGIPPVRRDIIRPLIEIERSAIDDFLAHSSPDTIRHLSMPYVIDSSNLKHYYLRNKIRHVLMPVVRSINRDIVKTLSRTADIFRDEERYFDLQVTKALMRLITNKTDERIELFLAPLEAMDTVLLRRVLRRAVDEIKGLRGIGFVHIEDIATLVKKGISGDRIYLPKDLRAIKGYSTLLLTVERPHRLSTHVLEHPGEVVLKEASLVLRCSLVDDKEILDTYGDGKHTAAIDADKVHFPLVIRPRIPGDHFYPFGFGKKKKLQDYFVDAKVPRDMRDAVPLLVADNEIVWVVGYRLDERYRIDKNTTRVLKFEVHALQR
ncbi:MAG: tRNA lysidine(34) synthetase TilS [Nitrospirota bacterium]